MEFKRISILHKERIIYTPDNVNLCILHRHIAADPQNYERYRDINGARLLNRGGGEGGGGGRTRTYICTHKTRVLIL